MTFQKGAPHRCSNTDTALTKSPAEEAIMATRHSSIPFLSSQEIRSVALYARVSTLNGQNPDLQLAELREYVQRRGWAISGEYVDLGVSGARESRPELNRMLSDAHARLFDA